jgi:hypothetical protein
LTAWSIIRVLADDPLGTEAERDDDDDESFYGRR